MADMGLGGGFAAGAGADALESILKQAFLQQMERKRVAQDQQRIGLEAERNRQGAELQRAQLASLNEARQGAAKLQAQQGADKLSDDLRVGQEVSPQTVQTLQAGDRGDLVKGATLGSRNIGGNLLQGQLQMTANPGKGPTYLGNSAQQQSAATDAELQRQIAIADPKLRGTLQMITTLAPDKRGPALIEAMKESKPDEMEDVYQTGPNGKLVKAGTVKKGSHIANAPNPPQVPLVVMQTVDEQGNPVTKIVKKEEGASYAKPANATTATRVASAEAVNKVGNDLIAKLSDPKYAAVVGPAMGRASSLQDFVGNPPPEFAELAGEIESYALANMGVHGMRSAQGAEQIKKLLEAKHTPESLIATVKGLNNFSQTFVAGNKPKAGGGAAPSAGKDPLGIR